MGLTKLEIEKHLVEFEILKAQLTKIIEGVGVFVPYTGAVKNVNLGSNYLVTTGRIGIGTAAPRFPFEVVASGYGLVFTEDGGTNSELGFYSSNGGWIGTRTNHDLHFFTNDSNPLMTIATDGKVNIGLSRTAGDEKLEIFHAGIQLELSYDATSHITFAADASGGLTIDSSDAGYNLDFGDGNTITTGDISCTDANIGGAVKMPNSAEILDDGSGYTQFCGDGTPDGGLCIAIPQTAGSNFWYGFGGTEHHYFGPNTSSKVEITDEGDVIATGRLAVGIIGFVSNENLRFVEDSTNLRASFETYSDTASHQTEFTFKRSHNDTPGTRTKTVDGDNLGIFLFRGVDTGSNWETGATIQATQVGNAGTRVPTKMEFYTASSTGLNRNALVVNEAGNVSMAFDLDVVGDLTAGTGRFDGGIGIDIAPTSAVGLNVNGGAHALSYDGVRSQIGASGTTTGQSYNALNFNAGIGADVAGNLTISALRGASGTVSSSAATGYTGTINNATGINAAIAFIGESFDGAGMTVGEAIGVDIITIAAYNGATINNAYGFRLAAMAEVGGTITNAYGLWLADVSVGGTSNHAIKTGLGLRDYGGGEAKPIVTKTSNYTVTNNDYTILADGTSSTVTITLIPAADHTGMIYNIKCIDDTNQVDINPNGSEEIDGDSANFVLIKQEVITIQSDGSNWWIL